MTMALRWATGIAAVTLLLILGVPGIADAHEIKADGEISTLLHINPDDNPTAGRPVSYSIFFSDTTGRFSLPKCNCTVAITKDGKLVAAIPLAASGSEVSENYYTFAEPGTYNLSFTGVPKTANAFQPFKLDYQIRVSREAVAQTMPVAVWIGMSIAVGLILLVAQTMHGMRGKVGRRKRK